MAIVNEARIKRTLEFIQKEYAANLCIPTYRMIIEACGYTSPETLSHDMARLRSRGELVLDTNGKLVVPSSKQAHKGQIIQIVGTIRCGSPTEACEEISGQALLPEELFGRFEDGSVVILTANGDSMTGSGIYAGDKLIVHRQPTAGLGEIVIAIMNNGEATCKVLKQDTEGYYLHATNPAYKDLHPDCEWFIYGRVVYVIHALTK